LDLTIEKLIYGGDGLARLPADDKGCGKAVFVPFVLEGEKVTATVTEEKPGFSRARVEGIVEASPHRIEARCPYFGRCGGCHYQHSTYEHQLEVKAAVLAENFRRLAKVDLPAELQVHPSPPWEYRNRTRLQVRTRPEFIMGYFRHGSHEVLPVEQCPISSPLTNRAIRAVWDLGREGLTPAAVREVEFFANDSQVLVEASCTPDLDPCELAKWGEELRSRFREERGVQSSAGARSEAHPPEMRGLVAFPVRSAWAAQFPSQRKPIAVVGTGDLIYRTKHAGFRVSAGSFFQVNRFLVDVLAALVVGGRSGEVALDLFAGVGLFSLALAASFRHIVAVESSQRSAADLKYISPPNVKAVHSTVDEYLATRGAKVRPDLVVVDPPRAGLGERVARALAKMNSRRLIYVSCDPATLARDLLHLRAGGYRLEQVHLVDLFPQSYHVESVLHLSR
jgi:23S rRNA (uracil1939-C5)-methyltransferase